MDGHKGRSTDGAGRGERSAQRLEILNKRWTMRVLAELSSGSVRFNELSRQLKVNPNTLSVRLKELEEAGLIQRKVLNELPPAVEYRLTDAGKTPANLCRSLVQWSELSQSK